MTAPQQRTVTEQVAAVSTAGSSDTTNIAEAPYAGKVSAVGYVADSTLTGANTNTRSVTLVNKGQTGAGSTVVATLTFNSGTNATAADEVTVPLSGTAANLVVASGDVLQWQSTAVGTGLADPGGLVRVQIDRGDVSS